jgi:phosphoserine phosphatase RsbU/P
LLADLPDANAEALALFEAAACGLLRTGVDGTILRVNARFCGWLGFRAEELSGRRRLQDLLTMGGRIFHQTHWAPLMQLQGSVSELKLDFVRADGAFVPMVLNAIRSGEGASLVYEVAAFVARDRDNYERELLKSRERLQQSVAEATRLGDEAKDRALAAEQMIGIVSHDLRNPLAGISMGLALLTRSGLSEGQQRTIHRIERSAERASALIADLLDFTQARLGGGIPIALATIDLREVAAQAVDELAAVYPTRRLKHEHTGEGSCMGDASRLTQLIGNLVSNAMAYGDPERVVTVTSSVSFETCRLAVHNYGRPIAAELQPGLFEPMSRGSEVSSAARSVGLGLFIVREIARAHAGDVSLSSRSADGTTFVATFPRR